MPDPETIGCVSSSFIVSLEQTMGDYTHTFGTLDPYTSLPSTPINASADGTGHEWMQVTSDKTTQPDGSGTIHSVLSYPGLDFCDNGCSGDLTLDVVMEYTFPNQYYTVTTDVDFVVNSGDISASDWEARVFYYQDSTLSGLDEGNQFLRTDSDGNTLFGVIRPDGIALEGVRTHAGSPIHYFAGDYGCPVDDLADFCPEPDFGGWILTGADLPDVVDPAEDIDNGFAVQGGDEVHLSGLAAAAESTSTFDLLFMECPAGTGDPTNCIETNGEEAESELASTGTDAETLVGFGSSAALLVAAGVAVTLIQRRRQATL